MREDMDRIVKKIEMPSGNSFYVYVGSKTDDAIGMTAVEICDNGDAADHRGKEIVRELMERLWQYENPGRSPVEAETGADSTRARLRETLEKQMSALAEASRRDTDAPEDATSLTMLSGAMAAVGAVLAKL
jgi:hypothetical protein